MKILVYPHSSQSGIGAYAMELAKYIDKYTDHELITMGDTPGPGTFISTPSFPFPKIRRYTPLGWILDRFHDKKIARAMESYSPDIIFTSTILRSVNKKIPVVSVAWTPITTIKEAIMLAYRFAFGWRFLYRTLRHCEGLILKRLFPPRGEIFLAVTTQVASKLKNIGLNAIYFPPGIVIREINIPKNDKFTLYLGARNHIWTRRKGLKNLLDALMVLKKTHPKLQYQLLVVGNIPNNFNKVLDNYSPLKDHIQLTGLLPLEETITKMASSHLYVAPSLYDEFGYMILESMSMGTAVIASDNASFQDMITMECGIITNIYSPDAFAKDLLHLIQDKDKCIQMGENARKRAKNIYSWDVIFPKLLSLFEKIKSGQEADFYQRIFSVHNEPGKLNSQ